MEGGLKMVFHALVISVILYVIMKYLLKQGNSKAIDRSVLIGALVLAYMVLFGHGMPKRINSNIL
jgi:hypothetical protein